MPRAGLAWMTVQKSEFQMTVKMASVSK